MTGASEASKHWKDAKRGGQWREQVLAAPTPGPQLVQQIDRAWLVWRRDGMSWREWGTARACGLT